MHSSLLLDIYQDRLEMALGNTSPCSNLNPRLSSGFPNELVKCRLFGDPLACMGSLIRALEPLANWAETEFLLGVNSDPLENVYSLQYILKSVEILLSRRPKLLTIRTSSPKIILLTPLLGGNVRVILKHHWLSDNFQESEIKVSGLLKCLKEIGVQVSTS